MAITGVLIGAAIGIGSYTFVYAKGYSYLTNDPAACANCHIMDDHYAAWLKSNHRAVAACNDCHMPHDFFGKWYVKAKNGFWHSFYFTTGNFPYPLRATEANQKVVEESCRYCHDEMSDFVELAGAAAEIHPDLPDSATMSCTRCHRYVGHWVR